MALTETQMNKALRYVDRKMKEDGVEINSPIDIVKWMINNPLPTKAEYQAQVDTWDAEDKAATIAKLQADLAALQGE